MYKFNIGESDELITITKKRMDAIKREVSDLQCELRGLKAGDNYLRVEEEHDGYFSSSHWEVISTEKLVYKLKSEAITYCLIKRKFLHVGVILKD